MRLSQAALRRYGVSATSKWEQFRADLPRDDPSLEAVADPGRRQQLFVEVVAELQLQAALQAAAQKAELEFTALLAGGCWRCRARLLLQHVLRSV